MASAASAQVLPRPHVPPDGHRVDLDRATLQQGHGRLRTPDPPDGLLALGAAGDGLPGLHLRPRHPRALPPARPHAEPLPQPRPRVGVRHRHARQRRLHRRIRDDLVPGHGPRPQGPRGRRAGRRLSEQRRRAARRCAGGAGPGWDRRPRHGGEHGPHRRFHARTVLPQPRGHGARSDGAAAVRRPEDGRSRGRYWREHVGRPLCRRRAAWRGVEGQAWEGDGLCWEGLLAGRQEGGRGMGAGRQFQVQEQQKVRCARVPGRLG